MTFNLVDFLFPKFCISCKSFGSYLCSSCANNLAHLSQQICPVCTRLSFSGKTHPMCWRRKSLSGAVSFFLYQDPIKTLIHKSKYWPYAFDYLTLLNGIIVKQLDNRPLNLGFFQKFLETKPVVVPVPLFWRRFHWRGYNQSEILANLLAKSLGLEAAPNFLIRIRATEVQAKLKGEKRKTNVEKAFEVSSRLFLKKKSLSILLVDDVWTSGSTLKACTAAIKQKFPSSAIWALTAAR